MKLVILSGRSGAGKTVALHALEDQEFYCIDNLPISMLPELINKLQKKEQAIAISIDARGLSEELSFFGGVYQKLRTYEDMQIEVLYLDADDTTLLKRFSETRRRHPLTQDGISLREAIAKEKVPTPMINFKILILKNLISP